MTPAINLAKTSKINYKIHEYIHDTSNESYGLEASQKLGVDENRVFKTLVIQLDTNDFAVGVVPVSSMLSMKLIAKTLNAKKAKMAEQSDVERLTGYVLGGVSPLAQKKRLKTVIDISAKEYSSIFVSAGKRGLEIELSAYDLSKLLNGTLAKICQ